MLSIQGSKEHDFANGTELPFEPERQQMLRAMPDCAFSQACNRLKKGRREATVDTSTSTVMYGRRSFSQIFTCISTLRQH